MDEYRDYDSPKDDQDDGAATAGPTLPGGVSLKTVATAALIVAVAAILWQVFVGPRSTEPPDLATATPSGAAGVVSGTLPAPWTPGSGASAGVGGTGAPSVVSGTRQLGSAGVATLPATVAAAPTSVLGTAVPVGAASALTTGGFVRVTGSGTDGIRYRYGPGLTFITIRIVSDGEVLRVMGGPDSGDGYNWYRRAAPAPTGCSSGTPPAASTHSTARASTTAWRTADGRRPARRARPGDRRLARPAPRALRRGVLDRPARLAGVLTVPGLLPAAGPVGMRSRTLMTLALRVMGNLITPDDRDTLARVWRGAGRLSLRLDGRQPFSAELPQSWMSVGTSGRPSARSMLMAGLNSSAA